MAVRGSKILTIIVGLCTLVAAPGCCMILPAKPIQPAYITANPPYTARLMFPYKEGEKVREVKAYQYEDTEKFPGWKRTLCWRIKARKRVPAKCFEVTIGEAPNGFEQVVPKQGAPFVAVVNRRYRVVFTTTNRNVHYGTWWYPGDDRLPYRMLEP